MVSYFVCEELLFIIITIIYLFITKVKFVFQ